MFFILLAVVQGSTYAQQIPDNDYDPVIPHPEYSEGKGPLVVIDEGHNNFHTLNGRYDPFAKVLRKDGYVVKPYTGRFELPVMAGIRILVIANAMNKINVQHWYRPTPSAFSPQEINDIKTWVGDGGSLFLIADHMPMGGAAADLARAFGFSFTNGFAVDTARGGTTFFLRSDNTLTSDIIANGRNKYERADSVVSFTGQAFRIPGEAVPIIRFDKRYTLLEPDTAWVFDRSTKLTSLDSTWVQGAYMEYGKGRVVVFGEAAMFTAQLTGHNLARAGLNSGFAKGNLKLLLNIIHWLDHRY